MFCYECCNDGQTREAVGLCHHCSAALCANHAHIVDDPVTANRPLNRIGYPRTTLAQYFAKHAC